MSLFVIFFLLSQCLLARASEKEGVFEKIKSGLQYAKNYLETAKEIADLVSRSLRNRSNSTKNDYRNDINKNNGNNKKANKNYGARGEQDETTDDKSPNIASLISGFFRLLGLDSSSIAAIAVNTVIFLAQTISSLFDVKPEVEESRSRADDAPFDPMRLIVENNDERVQRLVRDAQDPELPSRLIGFLDSFDAACVKLLICKCSPIILAAQNSLTNRTSIGRFDVTSWLPRFNDFEENADRCDDEHHDCVLFPEYGE